MNNQEATEFVTLLYRHLLERDPKDKELLGWIEYAEKSSEPADLIKKFTHSNEYKSRRRVHTEFAPGHYYSPVVDPSTVKQYVARQRSLRLTEIAGINISLEEIIGFWKVLSPLIQSTEFTEEKIDLKRFYYNNGNFPYGDAIILRAIIGYYRPKRIIEIGSGFSSACMLDAADDFGLDDFHMTCIDPDPVRVHQILRSNDVHRVAIKQQNVQDIPIAAFSVLEANDILFIDSTHVLKTGSDVHYELFEILPSLKSGVIIHFHDIQYPFEYPDVWINKDNKSWNEIYALRAFLMYNSEFQIFFWNSLLAALAPAVIEQDFPLAIKNSGGSIWIRKN